MVSCEMPHRPERLFMGEIMIVSFATPRIIVTALIIWSLIFFVSSPQKGPFMDENLWN